LISGVGREFGDVCGDVCGDEDGLEPGACAMAVPAPEVQIANPSTRPGIRIRRIVAFPP
jgi:hypothetical protein